MPTISVVAVSLIIGGAAATWIPRHSTETMTTSQLRAGLDSIDTNPHARTYLMKAATLSSMSIKKLAEIGAREDELGREARTYLAKLKDLVEQLR